MEFTTAEFLEEYAAFRDFMGDKRNTVKQVEDMFERLLTIYVNVNENDKDRSRMSETAIVGLQKELEMRLPYMIARELRGIK